MVLDVNCISKSELLFKDWLNVAVSNVPFTNVPWFPLISVHTNVFPSGLIADAVKGSPAQTAKGRLKLIIAVGALSITIVISS